jgi:hypothetical protein
MQKLIVIKELNPESKTRHIRSYITKTVQSSDKLFSDINSLFSKTRHDFEYIMNSCESFLFLTYLESYM